MKRGQDEKKENLKTITLGGSLVPSTSFEYYLGVYRRF